MIKDAMEKFLDLAPATLEEIGGITYTNRSLTAVNPPRPDTLQVNTLTGLVDYMEHDIDGVCCPENIMLHVEAYNRVGVYTAFDDTHKARERYIVAEAKLPQFAFGRFQDIEAAIIGLQTFFVQDEQTADILKIVGNITDESKATVLDDGVSQSVTAKVGIVRRADVVVPRIVTLRPYRTFLEVTQPMGAFILRIKSGAQDGEQPSVALFEADGGAWKLWAMEAVKRFLAERLPKLSIIA